MDEHIEFLKIVKKCYKRAMSIQTYCPISFQTSRDVRKYSQYLAIEYGKIFIALANYSLMWIDNDAEGHKELIKINISNNAWCAYPKEEGDHSGLNPYYGNIVIFEMMTKAINRYCEENIVCDNEIISEALSLWLYYAYQFGAIEHIINFNLPKKEQL